jgi:type II secretory pathway component PulJ
MKRSGVTLIETMIAVSTSSMLLLLAIGVLHQAMRLSSKAKNRTEFHQSDMRLSTQFREDVHRATKTELTDDGSLILTFVESESIAYRMESGVRPSLVRELKRSGEVNKRQEFFRLLDSAKCGFKISDTPHCVTLDISTEIPGGDQLQRVELRVSATVNRWSLLTSQPGAAP